MIHVFQFFQYLIEEKNIKVCHLLAHGYKIHIGGIVHDLYIYWVFRNNGVYYFSRKIISDLLEIKTVLINVKK